MMTASKSSFGYTRVATTLHWIIAVMILFELGVGSFMVKLITPIKSIVVPLHFVAGLGVLALTVLLLAWRFVHRPPPLPIGMPTWRRVTAHTVDGLVYFMLLAMPIMGWFIISAHPWPLGGGENIWGWFILPPIRPIATLEDSLQRSLHTSLVDAHVIGGWIFFALLLLHVAGALKNHDYDR